MTQGEDVAPDFRHIELEKCSCCDNWRDCASFWTPRDQGYVCEECSRIAVAAFENPATKVHKWTWTVSRELTLTIKVHVFNPDDWLAILVSVEPQEDAPNTTELFNGISEGLKKLSISTGLLTLKGRLHENRPRFYWESTAASFQPDDTRKT